MQEAGAMTMPMPREQQRANLQINVARAKLASDKKRAAEAVEVLTGYDGTLVEDLQHIRNDIDEIRTQLP